jgi:hypothetical protein
MPYANEQALHKALQNNPAQARDPHEPAHLRRRSHRALMLIAAMRAEQTPWHARYPPCSNTAS